MNLTFPDPTPASQPDGICFSLACVRGFLLTQGCFHSMFLLLCWVMQCDVQRSALGSPGTFQCATPPPASVLRLHHGADKLRDRMRKISLGSGPSAVCAGLQFLMQTWMRTVRVLLKKQDAVAKLSSVCRY